MSVKQKQKFCLQYQHPLGSLISTMFYLAWQTHRDCMCVTRVSLAVASYLPDLVTGARLAVSSVSSIYARLNYPAAGFSYPTYYIYRVGMTYSSFGVGLWSKSSLGGFSNLMKNFINLSLNMSNFIVCYWSNKECS